MSTADNYSYFIQSKPFRFLVGPDGIEFFVHQSLVRHHSHPLKALVQGQMKEAKEGSATIDDVDEDTFARVTEYIYTGNYQAADYSILLDADTIVHDGYEGGQEVSKDAIATETISNDDAAPVPSESYEEPSPVIETNFWNTGGKKKSKKGKANWGLEMADYNNIGTSTSPPATRQQRAWEIFISETPSKPPNTPKLAKCTPRPNEESCEDYTDTFLSHAKVYVFADAYDMEGLRYLSLHKLHKCLSCFTFYEQRAQDIATLFQYAYNNTAEREGVEIDGLRNLVVKFVCCHIEKLLSDDIFQATIKAENSASIDILEGLRQRLD